MKCKYHPLEPALNQCVTCDSQFCEVCSDESASRVARRRDEGKVDHACFVCGNSMEPLSGAVVIPAFWSDLSRLYRYPVTIEAIIVLLSMSLMGAFFRNSFLLLLIPSAAMMLYSFACLRETAKGKLDAPGIDACFDGSLKVIFYMVLVFLVMAYSTWKVFEYLGVGFGILTVFFYIIAAPAAIMILSIEERLLPAINPSELFSIMRAMEGSYFVMLLFLVIMTSSVGALGSFFGGESNSFLGVLVQSLISNYYSVVIFHIMGYLVYQNQEALGFKSGNSQRKPRFRSDAEHAKAKIDVLVKAGYYEQAGTAAIKYAREPQGNLWDWSRAFTLVCIGEPNQKILSIFSEYVKKLEALGENDKIAEAYLMLRKQQPDCRLSDVSQRLLIADSLYEIGQYPHVVKLLQTVHKESDDVTLVTRALKLTSESFSRLPGREKFAKQYSMLYQMQLKKIDVGITGAGAV